jgi:hypothetical protein
MLPAALSWLQTAEDCFQDEYGSLRRGLLASVFLLVTGIERVFHLDQMEDLGFALLTGGRCVPTRHMVGAWRRHVNWHEADAFCRRTSPWQSIRGQEAEISFDEHSIPRWTKKFSIRKGYITTRNKYMRCEKLYYGYDVRSHRYLTMRATQGPRGVARRFPAAPAARAGGGAAESSARLLRCWCGQERRRRTSLARPGR